MPAAFNGDAAVAMKVGELFKPQPDPLEHLVPARFPACCHSTAVEVMREWQGRSYSTDELEAEVVLRIERQPGRVQSPPPMAD